MNLVILDEPNYASAPTALEDETRAVSIGTDRLPLMTTAHDHSAVAYQQLDPEPEPHTSAKPCI